MKLSGNRMRTHTGKIIHFKSASARNEWETFNNMRKHNPNFKKRPKKR